MKNQKLKLTALYAGLFLMCYSSVSLAIVDPTRPPDELIPKTTKEKVAGPLQVTAIYTYANGAKALINGDMVKVGDQVDTYTVINIRRDAVELKGAQTESIVLNLLPKVKVERAK